MTNKRLCSDDYSRRFKCATSTYSEYVRQGQAGQQGYTADSVAAEVNADRLEGSRMVTGQRISRAVAAGEAGESPPAGRGPKRKLPADLYEGVGTFAELSQLNALEKKGKALWGKITTAVQGTPLAQFASNPRQAARHLRRVLRAPCAAWHRFRRHRRMRTIPGDLDIFVVHSPLSAISILCQKSRLRSRVISRDLDVRDCIEIAGAHVRSQCRPLTQTLRCRV